MRHSIWITASIASVAVGALALMWPHDARSKPRQPAVEGREVRSLPPLPPRVPAPVPAPSSATSPPDASGAPADEPPAASERPASLEEVRDRLDADFYAHAPDPGQARELEGALARELPAHLPDGSRLRAIDCRAGTCRVETAHASVEAYQQFVEGTFGAHEHPLPAGFVFTGPLAAPRAGQPLLTVAYVTAPGVALPGTHAPGR